MTKPVFIYFHGSPGAEQELDLVGAAGWRYDINFYIPNRHPTTQLRGDALFDQIALDIQEAYPERPLRLIGFSLGGSFALQMAYRLGEQVERVDLIAPAAPLELGDFLPHMIGKPVFKLAKKSPFLLSAQVKVQSLLVRYAPNTLYNIVFSSAVGGDIPLAKNEGFKAVIIGILKTTVTTGSKAYVRELCTYVQPWAHILEHIKTPTTLWHGTDDNWAPLSMSEALQKALPEGAQLNKMLGLSHYSALIEALPKIVKA
ncbi:MAG: hypothetical protein COA69_12375 [Robiginitomaculum sp.]|nr:MAG: hypothetical protein COA69_12375 [Robiginitomaculum sp.]